MKQQREPDIVCDKCGRGAIEHGAKITTWIIRPKTSRMGHSIDLCEKHDVDLRLMMTMGPMPHIDFGGRELRATDERILTEADLKAARPLK